MDKKIKDLIDKNVFKTNILDYDIQEITSKFGEMDLIIYIFIDHYKLWKSSGRFDQDYYDLIYNIDDGVYDESIEEFLPMIGYDFDFFTIRYTNKNGGSVDYSAYKPIANALKELNLPFKIQIWPEKPWLYLEVFIEGNPEVYSAQDVYEILEEEYDLDLGDIVFIGS
jgi:hypothetical protein